MKNKTFLNRAQRSYKQLRICTERCVFHGFNLKPGMFFGEDEDGFFVTYGNRNKNGYVSLWRLWNDDADFAWKRKDGAFTVRDWHQALEEEGSWLDMAVANIPGKARKYAAIMAKRDAVTFWKNAPKRKRKDIRSYEAPANLGLRLSNMCGEK